MSRHICGSAHKIYAVLHGPARTVTTSKLKTHAVFSIEKSDLLYVESIGGAKERKQGKQYTVTVGFW